MFDIHRRLDGPRAADIVDEIYLDHLQREKSRLRTQTLKGSEARIILDRGKPLRPGDILLSDCGHQWRVRGAKEPVITAISSDWKQFSRACYHLGNRHVRLQLGERWLRIFFLLGFQSAPLPRVSGARLWPFFFYIILSYFPYFF